MKETGKGPNDYRNSDAGSRLRKKAGVVADLYSSLVLMAIVVTLLTPVLLKIFTKKVPTDEL